MRMASTSQTTDLERAERKRKLSAEVPCLIHSQQT